MRIEPSVMASSPGSTSRVSLRESMQRPSSPVAPAVMGPPTSKLPSVGNDKLPQNRAQTPSERSSTSSRSKRDTCFVCTTSSAYDSTKLIDCYVCKRKFHRGCHKPPVAQNSPPDWTCYMCAPPKTMPPAGKKRKLGRSVFAPTTDKRSRMSLDGKEIPEAPQEQPNTTSGTASKSVAFVQPPRFAPFTTEAEKRRSTDSLRSARQVQPPRFAPSASESKDHSVVKSTELNLKSESEIGKCLSQSLDPGIVIFGPASQMPIPKPATSNKRPRNLQSNELIGMALNDAPECCLSREGIQRWIVDNVPGYDSQDASWQRGVWVTLSTSEDFVYLSDKAKTRLWTFSDGSSNKYRKWQKPINTTSRVGSSLQDVPKGQERIKQGGNAFGGNAEALASDDELANDNPETRCYQIISKKDARARSISNSALPSTIDETLKLIDLTMDNEPLLPPSDPQGPERSTTGHTSSSLPQAPEDFSMASSNDRQQLKRSNFVAFGKPVWGSRTSVAPELNSSTPSVDNILKDVSKEMKEDLRRGGEKWDAACERMRVSVKSPLKAKIDLIRKSRTKSPMNSRKPTSSVSQPLASPNTQDAQLNPNLPQDAHGSQLDDLDTGMQNNVLLHSDLSYPNIAQEPTTAGHLSAEQDVEMDDRVVQMDLDLPGELHEPEVIEPEPFVPNPEPLVAVQVQSDEIIQSEARQEQLSQEPFSHGSLAEGSPAQEPRRTYADSAAQTSLPVTSAFALEKITQISLEPRVSAAVTSATVRATANSTTQTESLPKPQASPPILAPAPTVQLPTPQAEPIEPQPPTENELDPEADFEKDCLSLLDEMLYPTKPTTPNWPSHFTSLPDPFFMPSTPLSTIQARPTRKQIFGKIELSRIEHNDALTKLNDIKLGAQNVGQIALGKGYTEEERKREIEANEKEGYYDTLEELFNMPQQVVPFIHEQQLAFRDYAPNALGRIGRPRVIYKIGPNAR